MPDVPFPYPGNKARHYSWISNFLADHEAYVDVFGGAGGILFNKGISNGVEVYNDKDEDLVHFFEVLRENEKEIVEWLEKFPFSRSLHNKWAKLFYGGFRHKDDVKRAGIFFFLRYAQWGSKYGSDSGFAFSKVTNDAVSFKNARDRLDIFANRLDGIVIECLDWQRCMDNYDGKDTLFYLDPPYYKDTTEQHYQVTGFDHEEFVKYLHDVEGKWLLSYSKLPPGLDDYHIEEKESNYFIGNGKSGESKKMTEHLIMNYDPNEVSIFEGDGQTSASDYVKESSSLDPEIDGQWEEETSDNGHKEDDLDFLKDEEENEDELNFLNDLEKEEVVN